MVENKKGIIQTISLKTGGILIKSSEGVEEWFNPNERSKGYTSDLQKGDNVEYSPDLQSFIRMVQHENGQLKTPTQTKVGDFQSGDKVKEPTEVECAEQLMKLAMETIYSLYTNCNFDKEFKDKLDISSHINSLFIALQNDVFKKR